ncbi:MAG TPA: hypothetical protein VHK06_00660 [Candidatus Limnocylindria bacterium]|nr:hypothetical protein [Candidatus Limnocylindria bacterium]
MLDKPREALRDTADTLRDTGGTLAEEWSAFWWLVRTAFIAAALGAVWTELRKPPEQRTWHGRLFGVIPYDFRLPSLGRLREAYWNPSSNRLFTDRPLGVGWAINLPVLLRRTGVADRLPLPGVGRSRAAPRRT